MKRSEILNLISNFLYEHNLDAEEADEEADKLLSKLEAKGMLPPAYTPEPFYHKESGKQLQLIDINEWEKEQL